MNMQASAEVTAMLMYGIMYGALYMLRHANARHNVRCAIYATAC